MAVPTLKRPLFGPSDPHGPSQGRDVKDFVKRTLYRLPPQLPVGDNFFPRPPEGFNSTYNQKTEDAVKVFQHFMNSSGGPHIPVTGQFGQLTLNAMWDYADAYSKWVYRMYVPPKPPAPALIEPIQGWDSLKKTLWADFSLGRSMGLSDLGTYNPASRLPSGAPSDHAIWPAVAFDLGVDPDNGYANPTGRKFFDLMVGRSEVHYVILGDKIWSHEEGLHAYTYGGHENHCHTSGYR